MHDMSVRTSQTNVNEVLGVSIVAAELDGKYGVGIELSKHGRPVKLLSFYISDKEVFSIDGAVYYSFSRLAAHIPNKTTLMIIRKQNALFIGKKHIRSYLGSEGNANLDIYIPNATLINSRYRELLALAKVAINTRADTIIRGNGACSRS